MPDLFSPNIVRAVDAICRARKTDPETSHIAAKNHKPRANSNSARIYSMLGSLHIAPTAAELAGEVGLDHVETQRRLSDLCRKGLVCKLDHRICHVKGSLMTTWEAIDA